MLLHDGGGRKYMVKQRWDVVVGWSRSAELQSGSGNATALTSTVATICFCYARASSTASRERETQADKYTVQNKKKSNGATPHRHRHLHHLTVDVGTLRLSSTLFLNTPITMGQTLSEPVTEKVCCSFLRFASVVQCGSLTRRGWYSIRALMRMTRSSMVVPKCKDGASVCPCSYRSRALSKSKGVVAH